METYSQFLSRINSFEKKTVDLGTEYFKVAPSVAQKVDKTNKFKNFYGDTAVFDIDDDIKSELTEYIDLLYKAAPECFCEKLIPDTLHMTLHDMSNSPHLSDIAEELFYNELKIKRSAFGINKCPNIEIKMKRNFIFNMVNTSLVLGLYPADECEYKKLMGLYEVFDDIKKSDYPLTPHITLAYYNANGFDGERAKVLEHTVNAINANLSNSVFVIKDLYYQKFTSMNDYTNIIKLV